MGTKVCCCWIPQEVSAAMNATMVACGSRLREASAQLMAMQVDNTLNKDKLVEMDQVKNDYLKLKEQATRMATPKAKGKAKAKAQH